MFGKDRKKSMLWVTSNILDLFDKRRELKKIRKVDPEIAKLHNEVNVKIRNKMKEVKEI